MLSTNTPGAIYPYAWFHALPRKLAKNKGDTGRAWRAAAFPIDILRHVRWGFVSIDSWFGDSSLVNIEDVVDVGDVVDVRLSLVWTCCCRDQPTYIYNSQTFKMVWKNHELFELFSRIKMHQELTLRASISVSVVSCERKMITSWYHVTSRHTTLNLFDGWW